MARDDGQKCECRQAQNNRGRPRRHRKLGKVELSSDACSSDSEVEPSPYVSLYAELASCAQSASLRQVDTLCGTHTYTLVGYTLARAMGPGTRLCSDLFEVAGQLFRLELFPAGLCANTHNYVALFLTTPGTTRPAHLLYDLSIVDVSTSRPQHITESRTAHPPSPAEPAAVLAPHPSVVGGFPKFIKANFLHRNARRFLPKDTVTIRATVRVLTGRSSFPVGQPTQTQLFSLHPSHKPQAPPYGTQRFGAPCTAIHAVHGGPLNSLQPTGFNGGSCDSMYGGGTLPYSAHIGSPYSQQQWSDITHTGRITAVPFPGPGPAPVVLPSSKMPYVAAPPQILFPLEGVMGM